MHEKKNLVSILAAEAGERDGSPASSYYSACLLAISLDALPIDLG